MESLGRNTVVLHLATGGTQGAGCMVQGSGYMVQGTWYRAQGTVEGTLRPPRGLANCGRLAGRSRRSAGQLGLGPTGLL